MESNRFQYLTLSPRLLLRESSASYERELSNPHALFSSRDLQKPILLCSIRGLRQPAETRLMRHAHVRMDETSRLFICTGKPGSKSHPCHQSGSVLDQDCRISLILTSDLARRDSLPNGRVNNSITKGRIPTVDEFFR